MKPLLIFLLLGWIGLSLCHVDPYKVLGVTKDSNAKEIKDSYRKLSRKFHPDHYDGDKEEANKKFMEINEAYEILSDPDKRREYDTQRDSPFHRHGGGGGGHHHGGGGGFPFRDPFEAFFRRPQEPNRVDLTKSKSVKITEHNFDQLVGGAFFNHQGNGGKSVPRRVWLIEIFSVFSMHCAQMAPTWEDIAEKLSGIIQTGRIEGNHNVGLIQRLGVYHSLPAVILLKEGPDGEVLIYPSPIWSSADILNWVESHIPNLVISLHHPEKVRSVIGEFIRPVKIENENNAVGEITKNAFSGNFGNARMPAILISKNEAPSLALKSAAYQFSDSVDLYHSTPALIGKSEFPGLQNTQPSLVLPIRRVVPVNGKKDYNIVSGALTGENLGEILLAAQFPHLGHLPSPRFSLRNLCGPIVSGDPNSPKIAPTACVLFFISPNETNLPHLATFETVALKEREFLVGQLSSKSLRGFDSANQIVRMAFVNSKAQPAFLKSIFGNQDVNPTQPILIGLRFKDGVNPEIATFGKKELTESAITRFVKGIRAGYQQFEPFSGDLPELQQESILLRILSVFQTVLQKATSYIFSLLRLFLKLLNGSMIDSSMQESDLFVSAAVGALFLAIVFMSLCFGGSAERERAQQTQQQQRQE